MENGKITRREKTDAAALPDSQLTAGKSMKVVSSADAGKNMKAALPEDAGKSMKAVSTPEDGKSMKVVSSADAGQTMKAALPEDAGKSMKAVSTPEDGKSMKAALPEDDGKSMKAVSTPEDGKIKKAVPPQDPDTIRREYEQKQQEAIRRQELKKQQIYAANGVSADLIQGIREYGNATFKGCAMVVSGITVLMIAACALVCGVTSKVTLYAILAFALEGTLLAQENRPNRPMRILSRVFFMFPLPMTIALFIVSRAGLPELVPEILLIVFGGIAILLTGFGSICYYIHDPYRTRRKAVGAAKRQLKELARQEKKEAKEQAQQSLKTHRKTEKQKKKAIKRLKRQDRKERMRREKEQLREFARRQKERADALREKAKNTSKNKADKK